MVTKNIDLGTLIPIFLFLLAQTGAALWWASTTNAHVGAMLSDIDRIEATQIEENQRRREQNRAMQAIIDNTRSAQRVLESRIDTIGRDISRISDDQRRANDLLRQLLLLTRTSANADEDEANATP